MSSKSRLTLISLVGAIICILTLNQGARADTTPPELQGSGRPVPRFVTLNSDKAYIRSGPAPRYPVKWVYKKAGLPVEIIQEFDVWRKIRDVDGDDGWVNKVLLSDKRGAIVKSSTPVELKDDDGPKARITARLEPGVVVKLDKCTADLCKVETGGYSGWLKRNFLWGIYPHEEIN